MATRYGSIVFRKNGIYELWVDQAINELGINPLVVTFELGEEVTANKITTRLLESGRRFADADMALWTMCSYGLVDYTCCRALSVEAESSRTSPKTIIDTDVVGHIAPRDLDISSGLRNLSEKYPPTRILLVEEQLGDHPQSDNEHPRDYWSRIINNAAGIEPEVVSHSSLTDLDDTTWVIFDRHLKNLKPIPEKGIFLEVPMENLVPSLLKYGIGLDPDLDRKAIDRVKEVLKRVGF